MSKLSICNLALAHLGQAPIASLNQEDERARRLNLFYETIRDEVLRSHNWRFACVEQPLARVGDNQSVSGGFLYKYPSHSLFIRRVFDTQAPQRSLPFQILFDETSHLRVLQIPSAHAYAQYTRQITDETLFDASFVKVFSLALACDLAVTLTADSHLASQLFQKYQLSLQEARRSNMAENESVPFTQDCFTEVR